MSDEILFGGHATALLALGGTRIVTDPLLRGPLRGLLRRHSGATLAELGRVDAVLISHLHHDHLDLPSLRRIGPGVPIVGPPGAAAFLAARGFDDTRELAPGEALDVGGVTVRAVAAAHEGGRTFSRVDSGAVGYLLEAGAGRFYFAGDTGPFDGMADLGGDIRVALLPIWGWGPTLGEGHLDPRSAARAAAMIDPEVVVPIHWGTLAPVGGLALWPWLHDRPANEFTEALAAAAPGVRACVLRPGERLPLEART